MVDTYCTKFEVCDKREIITLFRCESEYIRDYLFTFVHLATGIVAVRLYVGNAL